VSTTSDNTAAWRSGGPAPPAPYAAERRVPTVAELRDLHESAAWDDLPDDDDAVARGLAASLFGIVVIRAGRTVAAARVVGDGALYFYVQDVVVLPAHQGRGLGTFLMEEVMAYLRATARPKAFVALFAATGRGGFYRRYGFRTRPLDEPGMALEWPPSGTDGRRS
jgi:GNAT superfamily N-acetyltransferase